MGNEVLFRVEWHPDGNGFVESLETSEAAILAAEGLGDNWSFRLRFPERAQLSAFYRACIDQGVRLELREVTAPTGFTRNGGFDITDAQREALLAAFDAGYFAVPRAVTLEELAGELGISDTALSQRIRRGLTALLSSSMVGEPREERADDG